jgi:hypothetical protein
MTRSHRRRHARAAIVLALVVAVTLTLAILERHSRLEDLAPSAESSSTTAGDVR